ncbi:MAG: transposase, partial [Treponema sp.]|nr:transposase [Treponema sp.]
MYTKRTITAVTAQRYRAADRKGKTAILDEFTVTTGYNRKYALHILANWGGTCLARVEGKTVKLTAARPKRKRKPGGGRPKVYSDEAVAVLE